MTAYREPVAVAASPVTTRDAEPRVQTPDRLWLSYVEPFALDLRIGGASS